MIRITARISAICICVTLFFCGNIYAAVQIDTSASMTDIVISGSLGSDFKNLPAAIQIVGPLDENKEFNEVCENKNFTQQTSLTQTYLKQIFTDSTGSFSFTYTPSVREKFYAVAVRAAGMDAAVVKTMFITRPEIIDAAMKEIGLDMGAAGEAEATANLKATFEKTEYVNVLVNNMPLFKALPSETYRQRVYAQLFKAKSEINSYELSTYGQFKSICSRISAVQCINTSDTNTSAVELLQTYIYTNGVRLTQQYGAMSQASKEAVMARVRVRDNLDAEALISALEQGTFLQYVQDQEYASNLTAIISENASYFQIDVTDYAENSSNVNIKLFQQHYNTIGEFQTSLRNAVNSVKGESGGNKKSPNSGGGHTSSITTNVVIPVVTPPPQASPDPNAQKFSDLQNVEWAVPAIEWLVGKGIVNGKETSKFYPNDSITREEFVKIIVTGFGISGSSKTAFSDTREGDWHYPYIDSATGNGIVKGVGADLFGVGEKITRQDLAVILYRAAKYKGMSLAVGNDKFADNDKIDDYAIEAVYALKNAGVIMGMENGNFMPKNSATRAEAAKMVYAILNR